jgi:ABC-type nitrate/sulfonate/bicarbonate transport system substrate-binding protein
MSRWSRVVLALALACLSGEPAGSVERLVALDVDMGDISLNKVPYLIASDTGIYARNGLDVRQYITPAAAETARRSGVVVPAQSIKADVANAPIALGSGTPMMYRVTHDPKAVHRVVLTTGEDIIRETIITTSAIGKVEDLKGKRLGYSVPGTAPHVAGLAFAKRMGWDPDRDVSLIGNANGINPLKEGRTDAFFGSAMNVSMAPEMNLKLLIDLTQYRFPVAGSGIMADREWLKSNRDTAVRFVRAAFEAIALMKKDRAAFDAALAKWLNITDKAALDRMYGEIELPEKPYPSVEGIRQTFILYDSPEMRKYKPEDFYDSSIVTELDRSGFIDRLYQ